jgi:hypothetical protein
MSAPARAVGIGADFHHGTHTENSGASSAGNSGPASAYSPAAAGGGVQQGTLLTRTLYVHITGTLANLNMAGPSGGTWKLVDGKAIGVFGMGAEVDSQVRPPPSSFVLRASV